MSGPLSGITVIETGPLLPVPATGANLAALGARVIRIDPPGGDPARRLYGGWLHELYGHDKEAITLDLLTEDGRTRLDMLLSDADVVIVGLRPRAAKRTGLDAESIRGAHPRIVHCAIVGYPTNGERSNEPGHDLSFLAECGALSTPATPSGEGQPPHRPAIPVADLAAAATATQAVLAALFERQRTQQGRHLEVAIADVVRGWMAPRLGHAVDSSYGLALDPANDMYRCQDGRYITVAAIEGRFWSALIELLTPETSFQEGTETWDQRRRIEGRVDLGLRIARGFERRSSDAWIASSEDLPLHLVLDASEVVARQSHDPAHWRRDATALNLCIPGGHW